MICFYVVKIIKAGSCFWDRDGPLWLFSLRKLVAPSCFSGASTYAIDKCFRCNGTPPLTRTF